LASAVGGGGSGGGAPPPPPPGPPTTFFDSAPAAPPAPTSSASSGGAGGMQAVFDSISGKNVTSGLKKVDKSLMTHKNPELRNQPGLEPQKKASTSDRKTAGLPSEAKKEAKTYLNKGTWFVEHYDGSAAIDLSEVQLKESIYIMKCKNISVNIPGKCKSIQVDNCMKVNVTFKNVVSIFECFNSARVTIECTEAVPSIALDKSNGIIISLSSSAVKNPPYLVTSSISECNLQIPGKPVPGSNDPVDPVEIPLPEQYVTNIDPLKYSIKTEVSNSLG